MRKKLAPDNTLLRTPTDWGRSQFAGVAAVLLLTLYVILPERSVYYDVSPKAIVMLSGLGLLLLIQRGIVDGTTQLLAARAGRRFVLLLVIAIGFLIVSTLFSANPGLSMAGTNWRRMGFLTETALLIVGFLASCQAAKSLDSTYHWICLLAFGGVPVAIYALLQFVGLDPWLDRASYSAGNLGSIRVPATLGHAVYLSSTLVPMAFAAGWLTLNSRRLTLRMGAGLACFTLTAAIVVSGTRSALLALAAGVFAYVIALRPSFKGAVVTVTFVLVLVVVLLAGGWYFSPSFHQRMTEWSGDLTGGTRLLVWKDSLAMAGTVWPSGTGPETFSVVFPRFWSERLAASYPDHYHESPHNMLLDWLLGRGILALLGMLALLGLSLRGLGARFREADGLQRILSSMVIAGVVSHFFSVYTIPDGIVFYLCMGLAVGSQCVKQSDEVDETRNINTTLVSRMLAGFGAVAICFSLQLGALEWFAARSAVELDRHRTHEAIADFETARIWQPAGGCFDLWFALKLLRIPYEGMDHGSAAEIEAMLFESAGRATQCGEQQHNAFALLATLYGRRGYDEATERTLRESISKAPRWYEPHLLLSRHFFALGRLPEAQEEASTARRLSGDKIKEVREFLEMLDRRTRDHSPANVAR